MHTSGLPQFSVVRSQTSTDTEPSGIKLPSVSCETCRMCHYLFLRFVGSAMRLESWSCDVTIKRAMFVASGGSPLALRLGGHISLIDASHLLSNPPQGAPGKNSHTLWTWQRLLVLYCWIVTTRIGVDESWWASRQLLKAHRETILSYSTLKRQCISAAPSVS